jgi:hypothetical protein
MPDPLRKRINSSNVPADFKLGHPTTDPAVGMPESRPEQKAAIVIIVITVACTYLLSRCVRRQVSLGNSTERI